MNIGTSLSLAATPLCGVFQTCPYDHHRQYVPRWNYSLRITGDLCAHPSNIMTDHRIFLWPSHFSLFLFIFGGCCWTACAPAPETSLGTWRLLFPAKPQFISSTPEGRQGQSVNFIPTTPSASLPHYHSSTNCHLQHCPIQMIDSSARISN